MSILTRTSIKSATRPEVRDPVGPSEPPRKERVGRRIEPREPDIVLRLSGAAALAVIIGGFYALVGAQRLSDNSFLTHLATGREIIGSGLPATNPFLYSSTSFPVPSYWWSIALAVVEKLGSGAGLRLLTAALAGLLGALIVRLASFSEPSDAGSPDGQPGARTLLAVLVPTLFATVCLLQFLNSRPQLPGFVLLSLAIVVWNERRSPAWLIPVFAVWVNVHGTWLYGLAVLGLFFTSELVESRRISTNRILMLLAGVSGTVIGGALYPNRFEVMLLPTRQFGSTVERDALRMYAEWRPVPAGDPLFWLLIGLGLVALYGAVRSRRYASAISAVGLVLLGLSGYRMVPIAAIALVPLVSNSLNQLGTIPMIRGRVAAAVAVIGVALIGVAFVNSFIGPAYDMSSYPVQMVDRLERNGLIGGDVRSLSHDFVGNYLEWRLGSRANTYVDDRPGARTFLNYASLLHTDRSWRAALADANPDVIIWNKKQKKFLRRLRTTDGWVHAGTIGEWELFCTPSLVAQCRAI